MLVEKQKPTVVRFPSSAITGFKSQGLECCLMMSDNGPAEVSNPPTMQVRVPDMVHL